MRTLTRLHHAVLGALLLSVPAVAALQAQKTTPPAPLPERPLAFPAHEEFTLDNGLRVVVLSYGSQPVMSARLYLPGGRAVEPPELAGLASLAATVLTKGTAARSAQEISAEIEGVGGSLSASAGQDFLTISATTLTEHVSTAFELLEDVVVNATFPEEEVELARRQSLSTLQAELGQPQTIASRRFASVVYGEDHPYGVRATPETVQALTREDLEAFRDRTLHPRGAMLVVAGQVDREEVESLVRGHFESWTGNGAPLPELREPTDREETTIYLVHRPGSSQSVVSLGHLGIEPDNPDYFALQVMNRVLGGGADARLFQILREERGWTYGAYSQFSRPAHRGHFVAQAEVRPEVTDSTVVEILDQMRRIREEPVPEEELDGAKSFLAGSFPLRLETADQVAGQLASTLLLGLPLEHLTEYPERIREITTEDVRTAAREHTDPDRAAVIVVGDGVDLAERLEAVAPVEFFDLEGAPLTREEVLADADVPTSWDAARLEAGERRYEIYVEGNPMGAADYTLEREGGDWVSSVLISSMGSSQETHLRFSAEDFTPREVRQEMLQGPLQTSAELVVEEGRLLGTVELPEELGGLREYDQQLRPGTLFPGMEEYALAVADLTEETELVIPYLDLTRGEMVRLEASVAGEAEITVPAGTFETWRVEVSGGDTPLTLFLRKSPPHLLIRQEFAGQPVQFDLIALTTP